MPQSRVKPVSPREAFELIQRAQRQGRRIVPLFGSGISVDAGIPTSAFLADYIVSVCAMAAPEGLEALGLSKSQVKMKDFSELALEMYLASGEPLDRAGGLW